MNINGFKSNIGNIVNDEMQKAVDAAFIKANSYFLTFLLGLTKKPQEFPVMAEFTPGDLKAWQKYLDQYVQWFLREKGFAPQGAKETFKAA